MDTILDKENNLLLEWENNNPSFVKDGIANTEIYFSANPKLLFIMKEVNDQDGGGWDLRDFLKEPNRNQTWANVARWVYGIRNLKTNINWSDLIEVSDSFKKEMINQIAVINIKKTPGNHTFKIEKFKSISPRDNFFFKKQVDLYQPDIVILCGSVVSDYYSSLFFEKPFNWKMAPNGVFYFKEKSGQIIIAYSHPEARVQDSFLLYPLIEALRHIDIT